MKHSAFIEASPSACCTVRQGSRRKRRSSPILVYVHGSDRYASRKLQQNPERENQQMSLPWTSKDLMNIYFG
jgi:hypothetical protein